VFQWSYLLMSVMLPDLREDRRPGDFCYIQIKLSSHLVIVEIPASNQVLFAIIARIIEFLENCHVHMLGWPASAFTDSLIISFCLIIVKRR
jgi:hypothetical protein